MKFRVVKKIHYLIGLLIFAIATFSQQANAISQDTLNCLQLGSLVCFYEPTPCATSATASTPGITVSNSAAQQVAQQASTGGVNVGYALYNSNGQQLAAYNDTSENYGASITKSMLLVAYLDQVGSGTLSSTATTNLTDMIEDSDNGSAVMPGPAYWVYSHLNNGISDVTAVASAAGMTGFQPDTSDPLYILGQSKVTADDFAKFFSKIDTLLPAGQKSFGLGLLSNLSPADQDGLLQAGLPGTVYSKEGWKPENSGLEGAPYVVNQAAQFSDNGTTYGVAVTVAGTSDRSSGETTVKNVVSALVSTNNTSTNAASSTAGSCCASSSSGAPLADASSSSGVWNSGLKPPYIVEQYAINVLEDLAQKYGKPASDAVTQQHVLALVAWAMIEGGDINNSDTFNLYNTTQLGSDLGAVMQSTGSPAYASFDQGVEATARTLASKHGGMAAALLNPSSTAQDFAHAESYSGTSAYPGTQEWAGAAYSDPSGYEHDTWDPMIQTVKSSYKQYASLVIGGYMSLVSNKTDPSLLSTINTGGFSATSSGQSCSSSQGAQGIVQEALSLAWPQPFEDKPAKGEKYRTSPTTPTNAYAAALQEYNAGNYTGDIGDDCGVFVSTVMRASGADPNYPQSGTGAQWSYVVAHPNLYDIQYNVTSMSVLQPGDILIVGGPGGADAAGHTWIYVGPQTGGFYSASASLGTRSANLDNDQLTDPLASGEYMMARLK